MIFLSPIIVLFSDKYRPMVGRGLRRRVRWPDPPFRDSVALWMPCCSSAGEFEQKAGLFWNISPGSCAPYPYIVVTLFLAVRLRQRRIIELCMAWTRMGPGPVDLPWVMKLVADHAKSRDAVFFCPVRPLAESSTPS